MDAASLKRAASAIVIGVGGLLWLSAILFMAQTAQHSEQFSRWHPWILMINVAGLVVLVGLLGTKLAQLVRDWRGHVIGSRLKARMVWIFGVLATLPILLVYFFAVQFLNRGIDSWSPKGSPSPAAKRPACWRSCAARPARSRSRSPPRAARSSRSARACRPTWCRTKCRARY
jgi:hypothetical protein